MERWVISPFLSEKHVRILHNEGLLKDFSICAKPIIVSGILTYVNGEGAADVKEMLLNVFKDKISFTEVQDDSIVLDNVDKVYGYTYSSVNAGMTIQELEEMKALIDAVYNDDYNIPYINTIPGDIIAGIINNLLALHRVNNNFAYKELAYLLSKTKELFKDKPNANARGTVFKGIARRSTELDIIRRGIDFLIQQKHAGRQPESWRVY